MCLTYTVSKGFDLVPSSSHIACDPAECLPKISWLKKCQNFFDVPLFFIFYQSTSMNLRKKSGTTQQKLSFAIKFSIKCN